VRRLILALLLAAYAAVFVRPPSVGGRSAFDPLEPRGREVERAIESSRFADALPIADDLRSEHADDPTVAYWRAEIFRGLGRARDEAAAWEDYLRLSHHPDAACPALGLAYREADEMARSLDAFERCAAAAPQDPERWMDLAGAYEKDGRPADASDAFHRAASLDPGNPRIPGSVTRTTAGENAAAAGATDRQSTSGAAGAVQ